MQGTGMWYVRLCWWCLARIHYRGDSDVTVLVVRDSKSEWVVTGPAVAAATIVLVAAFAISRVRGRSRLGSRRTYAFLRTRPIMTGKGGSASPLVQIGKVPEIRDPPGRMPAAHRTIQYLRTVKVCSQSRSERSGSSRPERPPHVLIFNSILWFSPHLRLASMPNRPLPP